MLLQVNEQFTTYTAADVAEGLQDFLICIEMFLAALAHAYAFPPRVRTQTVAFFLLRSSNVLAHRFPCVHSSSGSSSSERAA
jgi:hypothetical protein